MYMYIYFDLELLIWRSLEDSQEEMVSSLELRVKMSAG